MASRTQPRVTPVLNGDEARYRRRYRTLKDMVNDLSDESNLLALRVHQIQRRMYDRHVKETGRPPAPVPVPENATWAPLVQNATHYPADVGMPPAKASIAPSSPPEERRNGSVSDLSSDSDGETASAAGTVSRKREREREGESERPSFRERRDRERERARMEAQRRRTMSADEGDADDDIAELAGPGPAPSRGRRDEEADELESQGDDEGSDGESARNVDAEIEDMMDDY